MAGSYLSQESVYKIRKDFQYTIPNSYIQEDGLKLDIGN